MTGNLKTRNEKREERLNQITAAARKVFFEKGYFASTMESIAKLAGVSKGTLYLYFKNKDDLYVSLIIPVIEEFTRLLRKIEIRLLNKEFTSARDVIMAFYESFMALVQYDPEGIRIFQVYQLYNLFPVMPQETRDKLWLIGKRNMRTCKGIISDCMSLGLLPPVNPPEMLDVLWGSFLGLTQLERSKYTLSTKDHLPDTMRFAFTLMAAGLTAKSDTLNKKSTTESKPREVM